MLKIKNMYSINGGIKYVISSDDKIEIKEKIHSEILERDTRELFCETTNVDGIYHFGCKQLVDSYDHSAGYIWSSRAGCINSHFGTQLYDDCVIDGLAVWSIDINILKPLVEEFTGKQYNIEKYYYNWDKNKEEPYYKLVEVE